MIYALWQDHETVFTLCPKGKAGKKQRFFLSPNAHVIKTFKAKDMDQAMSLYHEFMGWGTYIPMIEEF